MTDTHWEEEPCLQDRNSAGQAGLLVFPDDRRYHTRNLQFVLGLDGLILGICRDEGNYRTALTEIFHRPFAVNLCDHDVSVFGGLSPVHDYHVALQDSGTVHG